MRRASRLLAAALVALSPAVPTLCAVGLSACEPEPVRDRTWRHPEGTLSVELRAEPFALAVRDATGRVLLESAPALPGDDAYDPARAYAPIAVTDSSDWSPPAVAEGWDSAVELTGRWAQSARVAEFRQEGGALVATIEMSEGPDVELRVEAQGAGVRLRGAVLGDPGKLDRFSMGFRLRDDPGAEAQDRTPGDHFLGLGERFTRSDQRGQALNNWVQDGGFGLGESLPPGELNPFPNGEDQTPIPIPWFLSTRGYGLLLNGTHRTVHHLGDERPEAWRVESWRPGLDATLFADRDPRVLVEKLTELTGRPPEVADWALAPRRRGSVDDGEVRRLREARIPTTSMDTALHYFPNGGGSDSERMKAMTRELHAEGFRAIAYFTSFVSTDWTPVFEEAAAMGYFVKRPDGRPYVVLDYPRRSAMVDFTNPEALAWYQGWLERALDDGWDGWMYDFAEYVPRDAVFHDGTRGTEGHNLYPVLFQRAAHEVLERRRKGDYLIFVRSGFTGTGGLVPMVWSGDPNTDFSKADGLPAMLTGGLNAGMSGIPLWSSGISGYHSITTRLPDKELYLRWTEVGAFSTAMFDENNGEGWLFSEPKDRFHIWDDPEAVDVYRRYASLKTRMVPYVQLAVRQARERGTPVMRHLYLHHPDDPRVRDVTDEYMLGDGLLVAPVVERGARRRSVYLPGPAYFDFWTGARVAGGRDVEAESPLDHVPVYAVPGAIVPLLHPEVETLAPTLPDAPATALPRPVSAADRADFLELAVFAGGESSITLADGTRVSQSAPLGAFEPGVPTGSRGPLPEARDEAELAACEGCWRRDPATGLLRISLRTAGETVTAGSLVLDVSGEAAPKRYLFSIRH